MGKRNAVHEIGDGQAADDTPHHGARGHDDPEPAAEVHPPPANPDAPIEVAEKPLPAERPRAKRGRPFTKKKGEGEIEGDGEENNMMVIKSFARRALPKTERSAAKWYATRDTFMEWVRPRLAGPSYRHEESVGCCGNGIVRFDGYDMGNEMGTLLLAVNT